MPCPVLLSLLLGLHFDNLALKSPNRIGRVVIANGKIV